MKFEHEPMEVIDIDDKVLVVYKWGELTEHSTPQVWQNVEMFDAAGNKIWSVNGMQNCQYWNKKADTFVGTRFKAGKLQLVSFGGSSYEVNLVTGEVSFFEFHK